MPRGRLPRRRVRSATTCGARARAPCRASAGSIDEQMAATNACFGKINARIADVQALLLTADGCFAALKKIREQQGELIETCRKLLEPLAEAGAEKEAEYMARPARLRDELRGMREELDQYDAQISSSKAEEQQLTLRLEELQATHLDIQEGIKSVGAEIEVSQGQKKKIDEEMLEAQRAAQQLDQEREKELKQGASQVAELEAKLIATREALTQAEQKKMKYRMDIAADQRTQELKEEETAKLKARAEEQAAELARAQNLVQHPDRPTTPARRPPPASLSIPFVRTCEHPLRGNCPLCLPSSYHFI